jgi:hypothetical protein
LRSKHNPSRVWNQFIPWREIIAIYSERQKKKRHKCDVRTERRVFDSWNPVVYNVITRFSRYNKTSLLQELTIEDQSLVYWAQTILKTTNQTNSKMMPPRASGFHVSMSLKPLWSSKYVLIYRNCTNEIQVPLQFTFQHNTRSLCVISPVISQEKK